MPRRVGEQRRDQQRLLLHQSQHGVPPGLPGGFSSRHFR
jgi:hypothetical protein